MAHKNVILSRAIIPKALGVGGGRTCSQFGLKLDYLGKMGHALTQCLLKKNCVKKIRRLIIFMAHKLLHRSRQLLANLMSKYLEHLFQTNKNSRTFHWWFVHLWSMVTPPLGLVLLARTWVLSLCSFFSFPFPLRALGCFV
jgi:hypothetical protein